MKIIEIKGQPDKFDREGGFIVTVAWNWFERLFRKCEQTTFYSKYGHIWYYQDHKGNIASCVAGNYQGRLGKLLSRLTKDHDGTTIINEIERVRHKLDQHLIVKDQGK
jgi:hypothetical protein